MLMTKRKGMDNSCGQTEGLSRDNGRMESKTVEAFLRIKKGSRKWGYGVTVES